MAEQGNPIPKFVRYKSAFARQIADLFHLTVHRSTDKEYNKIQRDAWAPTPIDYSGWEKRLDKTHPILLQCKGKIVGFAELVGNGHIDCFYIHPDWQGKGFGKKLIRRIYREAKRKGITELDADVSLTALGFFQSEGVTIRNRNIVRRKGVSLINFHMRKRLEEGSS